VQFSGATPGLGLEWAFLYGALVLPLLLQFSLRERLITKPSGPNLAWAWCAMYVLMLQPLMARCPGHPLVWSMGVCSYCGLWIADTCLVQRVARLRREGRLTQANNVRFQFSLRSLLIFVLGFGGWLSGLVLFFRI
jgi:hypothetical protein